MCTIQYLYRTKQKLDSKQNVLFDAYPFQCEYCENLKLEKYIKTKSFPYIRIINFIKELIQKKTLKKTFKVIRK